MSVKLMEFIWFGKLNSYLFLKKGTHDSSARFCSDFVFMVSLQLPVVGDMAFYLVNKLAMLGQCGICTRRVLT